MTGRNANHGECAQPCRWKYALMEEKRNGEYYPVFEDDGGTYILNAKDMCMIEHLDKLTEAGVSSLKIEGRAKSAYYVATVTNAYSTALKYIKEGKEIPQWVKREVYNVSHREYCTGFYFDKEDAKEIYENSGYIRSCDFVGTVDKCENGKIYLTQRNYFTVNDDLEVLMPNRPPVKFKPLALYNSEGREITVANRATEKLTALCDTELEGNSVLRRVINN